MERSGMGFTIMENFMDEVTIHSVPGQGTTVRMVKVLKSHQKTMAN
jgi:stage II sporulation protein AB (anti-sigma F factor)